MKGKIISFILVFLMLILFTMPLNVYSIDKDFKGHWAQNIIQSWMDNRVVSGYPDGNFKPEELITRAEFVKIINNIFGFKDKANVNFYDVSQDDWYYEEIQKAYKAKYISGVSDKLFAPEECLTREQAVVILSNLLKLERNSDGILKFDDYNEISDWAKDSIGAAAAEDIIRGYDDKTFKPKNPITRAEAIVTLNRIIENKSYLSWNIGEDIETWDPALSSSYAGGNIIYNIFEGLTRETSKGIEPAAAERWDISEDGKTYTFYLREGLKWSDGKPLTAHDFEYAWKRVCNPDVYSDYAYLLMPYIANGEEYFNGEVSKDQVGIRALDDLTLEVKLKSTASHFLSLTSLQIYMPVRQDIVEAFGEGWEKAPITCVTNGPFKLKDYETRNHITLIKNNNYWDSDSIMLDGIKGLMINDKNIAFKEYENKKIQVLDNIPIERIERLKKDDKNFSISPQIATNYIQFNTDNELFDDVKMRKAFSIAIDRSLFAEKVTGGGEIPATGLIPPGMVYSDGVKIRNLDDKGFPIEEFGINPNKALVEDAKELLTEAGYAEGKGLPEITYIYNSSPYNKVLAQALQKMWKENLNADVKLEELDWAEFVQKRKTGQYMIAKGGWTGEYADPISMLEIFTSGSPYNYPQWRYTIEPLVAPHDTAINLEQAEFELAYNILLLAHGSDRDNALYKAESVLMNNHIIAPIYYYTIPTIVDKEKAGGIEYTISNKWNFRNARIIE